MPMTRKHHLQIAKLVRNAVMADDTKNRWIAEWVKFLETDNPTGFDKQMFYYITKGNIEKPKRQYDIENNT
jgi:hypothetical protein